MECIEKHSAHLKYSANINWTGIYRYRECLSYNSTSNALIFRGTSTVFGFSKLPGKLSSIAQVGVSVPVTNQQPVPGSSVNSRCRCWCCCSCSCRRVTCDWTGMDRSMGIPGSEKSYTGGTVPYKAIFCGDMPVGTSILGS